MSLTINRVLSPSAKAFGTINLQLIACCLLGLSVTLAKLPPFVAIDFLVEYDRIKQGIDAGKRKHKGVYFG